MLFQNPAKPIKKHARGSTQLVENPLPDFFNGLTILLFNVTQDQERDLNRYVVAFGGTVARSYNSNVTHIVTALDQPNLVSGLYLQ